MVLYKAPIAAVKVHNVIKKVCGSVGTFKICDGLEIWRNPDRLIS